MALGDADWPLWVVRLHLVLTCRCCICCNILSSEMRRHLACCRYWALKLNNVTVGEDTVGGLASTGALLDSGTSLIFTSDKDADALNAVSPARSPSERGKQGPAICGTRHPRQQTLLDSATKHCSLIS